MLLVLLDKDLKAIQSREDGYCMQYSDNAYAVFFAVEGVTTENPSYTAILTATPNGSSTSLTKGLNWDKIRVLGQTYWGYYGLLDETFTQISGSMSCNVQFTSGTEVKYTNTFTIYVNPSSSKTQWLESINYAQWKELCAMLANTGKLNSANTWRKTNIFPNGILIASDASRGIKLYSDSASYYNVAETYSGTNTHTYNGIDTFTFSLATFKIDGTVNLGNASLNLGTNATIGVYEDTDIFNVYHSDKSKQCEYRFAECGDHDDTHYFVSTKTQGNHDLDTMLDNVKTEVLGKVGKLREENVWVANNIFPYITTAKLLAGSGTGFNFEVGSETKDNYYLGTFKTPSEDNLFIPYSYSVTNANLDKALETYKTEAISQADSDTDTKLGSYYTKTEVEGLVSSVKKNAYQVVATLPSVGEEGYTYLVGTKAPYRMYIYENGWVDLGDTTIDISNYLLKSEASSTYATKTELSSEASVRESGDKVLQTNIDTTNANLATEVSVRESGDKVLQTSIDTEASARASGDTDTLSSAKAYSDTKLEEAKTYTDKIGATKQDTLVSGTNIATVNKQDITKGGNVVIPTTTGFSFLDDESYQIVTKKFICANYASTGEEGCTIEDNYITSIASGTPVRVVELSHDCRLSTDIPKNVVIKSLGNYKIGSNSFTTTAVTDLSCLDYDCLPSTRTNCSKLFRICTSIKTIPLIDTSNVTDMGDMFAGCTSLTTIPQLDTSKVINMLGMFYNCKSLTTIPQLDTSKVTNIGGMFQGCTSLTTIPQLDTSKVTNIENAFNDCSSLTTIPQLDFSNVTNANYAFTSCWALEEFHAYGMKVSFHLWASSKFTESALVEVLNNLATVTSTQTLGLGSTNLAKLTDDEKKIATDKGWTLA